MEANCFHCGKTFDCKRADKYCSVECRKEARQMREAFNAEQKICPHCNNPFIPENRSDQVYCSNECRTDAKAKRKNIELTERLCIVCGTQFMPIQNKQICCSPKCVSDRHYSLNKDNKRQQAKEWRLNNPERVKENNRLKKEKNPELYKQIEQRSHDKSRFSGNKSIALERDGYKCTRCGATENLAMHHKDGSGQTDNPNNDLDNLETLCSSCHTLHHNPRLDTTPHVINNCLYCGKDIRVSVARVEDERGKFCDKKCAAKYKTKMNTVTLICEHCGIEFTIPLSRLKRGMVKYHNMECRKAAGYAWTKYSRTEYNEKQALL